jgi:hypothetical protein
VNPIHVTIPPDAWREERGRDHLFATLVINGVSFRCDAYAVTVREGYQVTIDHELQEDFDRWGEASWADGHYETVRVGDLDYVVFLSPYC